MENLKALEEKYAALGEEIAKLKTAPKEWPQEGEEIWILCADRSRYEDSYTCHADKPYLNQGNLFRTEAEAIAERDARAVVAELRRQPGRKQFVVEDPNYGLRVDLYNDLVSDNNLYKLDASWNSIYFESEQATINAIKAVGEDRILKAARWWAMGEV